MSSHVTVGGYDLVAPARKPSQRTRKSMTRSAEPRLEVSDAADTDVRAVIAGGLLAYNEARAGPLQARPLAVVVRDEAGAAIGGLWGGTSYRWLFVELLYIPDALRGRRLGAALIDAAEIEARARGCIGAWLNTFEFQAPGFYERLGFTRFGVIDAYPPGHARVFLSKML